VLAGNGLPQLVSRMIGVIAHVARGAAETFDHSYLAGDTASSEQVSHAGFRSMVLGLGLVEYYPELLIHLIVRSLRTKLEMLAKIR
jgi:hypothetical protein